MYAQHEVDCHGCDWFIKLLQLIASKCRFIAPIEVESKHVACSSVAQLRSTFDTCNRSIRAAFQLNLATVSLQKPVFPFCLAGLLFVMPNYIYSQHWKLHLCKLNQSFLPLSFLVSSPPPIVFSKCFMKPFNFFVPFRFGNDFCWKRYQTDFTTFPP